MAIMRIFPKKRRLQPGDQDWGKFDHPALHYQKPKSLQRFQAFVALIASAALVFGLWSFGWYAMSALVKAEVKNWITAQRDMGAIVDFEEMKTHGFPSRITLDLTNPRYEGPAFGDVISWQNELITVMARPWTPWKLHVQAPGKHKLETQGSALKLSGTVETLNADVVLGAVWPEELDLNVQGLSMNGSAPLGADRLRVFFTHDASTQAGGVGLSIHAKGQNITIPGGLPQPLGSKVQSLDLLARVTGSVIPGPVKTQIPAWRDSGGAIDVERLKFRSGPVGMAAVGTAALDQGLQPQGAFTAKIEGLFQAMEILRAKGLMRDSDAVVATMALSALSKRPKGGGVPSINVALSVQDGELSIGPLKVMKMPHFDWGFAGPESRPETPGTAVEPSVSPRDYKSITPIY